MSEQNKTLPAEGLLTNSGTGYSRRRFLGTAGLLAGAGLGMASLASCNKDDDNNGASVSGGLNLGSGDVGILNYAYALEQLEAAFYAQVVASSGSAFTTGEMDLLKEIAKHEEGHAKFFKAAITAAKANPIQDLTPKFGAINFSDRTSVLTTAQTFEDLGVAAYNGAGNLIKNPDYLAIAGKIVSVEARHAALIRDLLSNGSFANLSTLATFGADNSKGLDGALPPSEVLKLAGMYINESLNASYLPTS
ncbi:MAG: ferritin-like domain-containing protein [Sphingobacteriales bacterium]|nr:MAG: ferritin-like domain-containing protein [Sphingobacteriales bacterium]